MGGYGRPSTSFSYNTRQNPDQAPAQDDPMEEMLKQTHININH